MRQTIINILSNTDLMVKIIIGGLGTLALLMLKSAIDKFTQKGINASC